MRFLNHHIIFGAFSAASLLFLYSCSDDTLDMTGRDSSLIRFSVSDQTDSQTRALSTLRLQGGEQELFLVPRVEEGINISKGDATRSSIVTSDNMVSFGVYAGYASEAGASDYLRNYMENVEITAASDWTPVDEYHWPGNGALHFNAYSPYFDSSSNSSEEGITALNCSPGSLTLDYSVPADVADQKDLLYASPIDASSSPCNLSFCHALTAIRFAAGAELMPCTIKSISISGVNSKGTLNLEDGSWSDLSTPATYLVGPNVALTAAENSKYVLPGTAITSDDQTFILLPQELSEDAQISVTMDYNGKETTLTASLADLTGMEWTQGKTITYRISANPAADSLILNVTGDFKTVYTGSDFTFNVVSELNEGGESSPVDWIAEFVDDNGNVIERPNWLTQFTDNGTGNISGSGSTQMQDLIFEAISPQSQTLQNAGDINASSGFTPYNLSSSTGSPTIENTANTYIINAPGSYSLPLVYGNAIKGGSTNSSAYTSSSHNKNALKAFVNHLNQAITSPYIYNNSGCTPSDAVLIWEDELNLIRNVSLSSDGHSITFDVPHNTIRQGNAIVAVRDAEGIVMWSWQIWVTDYTPSTGYASYSLSGKTYDLATANLGYIAGGDITRFPETSVKIRFSQTNLPEGVEPLSQTVELVQSGTVISTPDCNTFYQWGRKDPMMSSVKQWYNAAHQEIQVLPVQSLGNTVASEFIQDFIKNPAIFFTGSHDTQNPTAYPYVNLWNIAYSSSNSKSIYDPSPVGYVIPYDQPFMGLVQNKYTHTIDYNAASSATEKEGYYMVAGVSTERQYFPPMAYRSGASGELASGKIACYWISHALNLTTAGNIRFDVINDTPGIYQATNPLFHAMSLRPIKE